MLSVEQCNAIVDSFNRIKSKRIVNDTTKHDTVTFSESKKPGSLPTDNYVWDVVSKCASSGMILTGNIVGLKFNKGDFFGWSLNSITEPHVNEIGCVVINNTFKGGEFEYENGTKPIQTIGTPFLLSKSLPYRVTKITTGTMYCIYFKLEHPRRTSIL